MFYVVWNDGVDLVVLRGFKFKFELEVFLSNINIIDENLNNKFLFFSYGEYIIGYVVDIGDKNVFEMY